jgi:hypothetical protein
MPIDKLYDVDLKSEDANVRLKDILDKISRGALTVRYVSTVPTAADVGEAELVIYESGSTRTGYMKTAGANLFTFDIDAGTVLVSSNDTTAGYLNGKLVAGAGVNFTENNDGSDETLTIAADTGNDSLSPGNVVFSYSLTEQGQANTKGICTNEDISTGIDYQWFYRDSSSPYTKPGAGMILFQFKKIAGIDTVTFYAYVRRTGSSTVNVEVDIGGQNNTATSTSSTYTWINAAVDVSGLTDGTVYDGKITLWNTSAANEVFMISIIGIGS